MGRFIVYFEDRDHTLFHCYFQHLPLGHGLIYANDRIEEMGC